MREAGRGGVRKSDTGSVGQVEGGGWGGGVATTVIAQIAQHKTTQDNTTHGDARASGLSCLPELCSTSGEQYG